jgi:hypothetical protein
MTQRIQIYDYSQGDAWQIWEEELACLLNLTPTLSPWCSPLTIPTGTRALQVSKLFNYGEQESVNNKRELTYKLPARKQSSWVA